MIRIPDEEMDPSLPTIEIRAADFPSRVTVCPSCGSDDPERRMYIPNNPDANYLDGDSYLPCTDPFHNPQERSG